MRVWLPPAALGVDVRHHQIPAVNRTTASAAAPMRSLRREARGAAASVCEETATLPLLRCRRFRSAFVSAATWYRMAGSFSRALDRIRSSSSGASGFRRTTGTGWLWRMASIVSVVLLPRYGSTPVAISYSTTPKENRSLRESTSSPRACSGDMYDTVPMVVPGEVTSSRQVRVAIAPAADPARRPVLASPKSSSFASPRSVTKMFAGLMSR